MLEPFMTSDFEKSGFFIMRGVFSQANINEALAWVILNRERNDLSATFNLIEKAQKLPIKIRNIFEADKLFWTTFLLKNNIFPLVTNFLGSHYFMIKSAVFMKQPQSRSVVGLHFDEYLWGQKCEKAITLWIPLTNVYQESGCLKIVPQSHLEFHEDYQFDLRHPYHKVLKNLNLEHRGIDVPANAGDCLIIDKRLVHSSGQNKSRQERIALVLAFACCNKTDLIEPALYIELLSNGYHAEFLTL